MHAEFTRTRLLAGIEKAVSVMHDKFNQKGWTNDDKMKLQQLEKYREYLYECTAPTVTLSDVDFSILRHNGYVLNGNSVGQEKAESLHG